MSGKSPSIVFITSEGRLYLLRSWWPESSCFYFLVCFVVLSSRSVVSDSLQPHWLQHIRLPCLHHLLELPQIHVCWISDAIRPSRPLLSPSPPALNLSQPWIFSIESTLLIKWPKYWSFSFSISPSNEYSGLISFRIDWFYLLAVQETLRVFSNTIVQKHQFFGAQLSLWSNSHPYMTAGKTIALTRPDLCWQSDVSALIMLSRFKLFFFFF